MSIFEGEDEAAAHAGRVSDLNAAAPMDLALDPLRGAIGAIHDASGERAGTIVTDVATWWHREGLFRRRSVAPEEVVSIELGFEPVELGEDGYPVEVPWLVAELEKDDPVVRALLEGVLLYPGRELTVRWLQGADAVVERRYWDTRFDVE
jgi:hypothetical protein